MRRTSAPQRPRWVLVGTILALHGLLMLPLLGNRAWPDRGAASPLPALQVRLLKAPPPMQAVAPQPAAAAKPPTQRTRSARDEPQAIAPPAFATPGNSAHGSAEPQPGANVPLANAPLLLDLPRGASSPDRRHNPALADPRANSRPRSLESRIGQAMGGDDRLVEEILGDGRVRYRRGADCMLVQPARGAQLDPFNQSANSIPRLVGAC